MATKTRVGTPSLPTVTTAGTDNTATAPRVLTFDTYANPCLITNQTGGGRAIRAKINSSNTNFTTEIGFVSVPDGETVDLSFCGVVDVTTVSFVTENVGDDLDLVQVVGWEP